MMISYILHSCSDMMLSGSVLLLFDVQGDLHLLILEFEILQHLICCTCPVVGVYTFCEGGRRCHPTEDLNNGKHRPPNLCPCIALGI